jgi:hypothetical protein
LQHQEFEEHFYATWPNYIKSMDNQQLINLNEDKLKDINASYPETMLCLKHWVLTEMAMREI